MNPKFKMLHCLFGKYFEIRIVGPLEIILYIVYKPSLKLHFYGLSLKVVMVYRLEVRIIIYRA